MDCTYGFDFAVRIVLVEAVFEEKLSWKTEKKSEEQFTHKPCFKCDDCEKIVEMCSFYL